MNYMFDVKESGKNYYLLEEEFFSRYIAYNLSRSDVCRFVHTSIVRNNAKQM